MSLQYVMTLNGPVLVRRTGLLGITDTISSHPVLLLLGIGTGVFLASRRKRRR